jgi:hypothetical protein
LNITRNTSDKDADSVLEGKVNLITEGLPSAYSNRLYKIRRDNALDIANFILSIKTEINLSNHHAMNNIMALTLLSNFHNNKKSFIEMTRDDILSYLNRLRKPERPILYINGLEVIIYINLFYQIFQMALLSSYRSSKETKTSGRRKYTKFKEKRAINLQTIRLVNLNDQIRGKRENLEAIKSECRGEAALLEGLRQQTAKV